MIFEERITPAETTWRGAAGGLWSVAANWSNGIPGERDTAIFDGTGNTNSREDLVGVVQEHIGKLRITNAYTQTITLTGAGIVVDVLEMDGGTIT
jgi:hypothetical protein